MACVLPFGAMDERGHASQEIAPAYEYVDALHSAHGTLLPCSDEKVPAAHNLQFAEEFAPVTLENFPAAHWMQLVDALPPTSSRYVPGEHGEHISDPVVFL